MCLIVLSPIVEYWNNYYGAAFITASSRRVEKYGIADKIIGFLGLKNEHKRSDRSDHINIQAGANTRPEDKVIVLEMVR